MNSHDEQSGPSEAELRRQLSAAYDSVPITDDQIARIRQRPPVTAHRGLDRPAAGGGRLAQRARRTRPLLVAAAVVVLAAGASVAVVATQQGDTAPAAPAPSSSSSTQDSSPTSVVRSTGTRAATSSASPISGQSEIDAVASAYAKDYGVSVEEAKRILAQRRPLDALVTAANAVIPESRRVGTYIEPDPDAHVVAALTSGAPIPALEKLAAKSDGRLQVRYLNTRSAAEKQKYAAQHMRDWKLAYPDRIQGYRFDPATSDITLEFHGTPVDAEQAQIELAAQSPQWLRITVQATTDAPEETFAAKEISTS